MNFYISRILSLSFLRKNHNYVTSELDVCVTLRVYDIPQKSCGINAPKCRSLLLHKWITFYGCIFRTSNSRVNSSFSVVFLCSRRLGWIGWVCPTIPQHLPIRILETMWDKLILKIRVRVSPHFRSPNPEEEISWLRHLSPLARTKAKRLRAYDLFNVPQVLLFNTQQYLIGSRIGLKFKSSGLFNTAVWGRLENTADSESQNDFVMLPGRKEPLLLLIFEITFH